MKYKKKQQRLRDRQAWWDKQSDTFKRAKKQDAELESKSYEELAKELEALS